jgi:autotransporter-associated beta strand protein
VASSPPYAVNLGALALGSYGIYATVTDSTAPTPATATSASSTFKVNGPIWNGALDAQWATSGNWDGGVPGPADTATFNNAANGNTTLDLGGGATIKTILFDSASAAAYTIGSGDIGNQTLTLNDSGRIQLSVSVANNQLFNAAITLGTATAASYTLTNAASARTLTLAGNIGGGSGGAAGAKTLNIGSVGTTVIGGVITNGGATSVALTKTGAGVLTLTNANTFSGGLTLATGTLRLNNATALGTGTLTIAGGTLDNTSGGAISNANNNVQSWNGNFSFAGSGPLHLGTGAVTLSANRTVTATANALTVGGVVGGGAFSLTKAGVSGRLALSGANTYSGGTVVSAGTLSFLTTAAKPG